MDFSRKPKIPIPKPVFRKHGTEPNASENCFTRNKKPTTAISVLSNDEKCKLLANHTKPAQSASTTAKRNAAPLVTAPTKQMKVERKPPVKTAKIPPYDYKARFNDLLEKFKVMKNEFIVAKEKASDYDDMKVKCDDLDKEHKAKIELMSKLQTEHDLITNNYKNLLKTHEDLKMTINKLKQKVEHYEDLKKNYDELDRENNTNIMQNAKLQTTVEELSSMSIRMHKETINLRNHVQDLRGNIRVYCRIRPPLEFEMSKPLFDIKALDACSIEVEKMSLNSAVSSSKKQKQSQVFTFDGIFTPHCSQGEVFSEVVPMIQSALDGYNVCIFAYGQTGSGKTYTMEGGTLEDQYGIIPRTFDMIFSYIKELKNMGWEVSIRASFMEIYNESIFDLLGSQKHQGDHDIKMVDSKSSEVYVSNLREELITSSKDFMKHMICAQRNRQTAATLNNERSSRSHSVTQIKISALNERRKEKYNSNLNLVDLAGSESGKNSQRMTETKHINRSLSDLSKVILALQTNQAHIPYRNSKLTHLLMPSLGGNSKTLMLVNIAQFDECFSETLNSLRFATQVNSCKTSKAKKNITMT